jgi:tetratricopeptide (TPR) repeat protein
MVTGRQRRRLRAVLAVAALLAAGAVRAETPEELFDQGNSAYGEGRYADAAEAYEGVLRYRILDPRVEYNLGNARAKLGQLGQAILHYERARRMDPTDPEIRANLEFVRAQCFDRVEPPQLMAAVRWTRAIQDRLGPDRQAWAFLLLVWIVVGLLAFKLSRPGRWNASAAWIVTALIVLALLVAASAHSTYDRLEGQRIGVVLEGAVEVLAGPGENNPTLFTIHEGLTVEIRSDRDDWVQVSLPNGLNGWVPVGSLGEV